MKIRKSSCFLALVLALAMNGATVYAQDGGVSSHQTPGAVSSDGPDIGLTSVNKAVQGNWFWGLLNEQTLLSGATALAVDSGVSSVIYAGGPGYIAVSDDFGVSWREAEKITVNRAVSDDSDEGASSDSPDSAISGGSDKRAEALRDYLRTELEQQFDSDFVDEVLEEITDDELIEAEDISDIDALKDLELDMESDLTQVQLDTEGGSALALSLFDPFIMRYLKLMRAGAEPGTAIDAASSTNVVWQFVTTADAVYAVTSDVVLVSRDHGGTWKPFYQTRDGSSNLWLHVDDSIMAVGTSSGVRISRDRGRDWISLDSVISGAVFEFHRPRGSAYSWVLSTEGVYVSQDQSMTWQSVDVPLEESEIITGIVPGGDGRLLVITNESLYYSQDRENWSIVGSGPFPDEYVRQVIPLVPSLSSFIVRTDSHIYEFSLGAWRDLNRSLYTSSLGPLIVVDNGVALGMMATPAGIWMAQDNALFETTPELSELMDSWKREPSDDLVIAKAQEAHYLDEMIERSWGTRSRLSWLLPVLSFNYLHNDTATRYRKTTFNQIYGLKNGVKTFSGENMKSDEHSKTVQNTSEWQILAHWNLRIGQGLSDEKAGISGFQSSIVRRAAVANQVQRILNKRRALQITMALKFPKVSTVKKKGSMRLIKTQLGIQEQEATLHYLTGGYYIPAVHQERNK